MPPDFWSYLAQYGWPVAMVGLFMWRDWEREKRMSARLDLLEDRFTTLQGETIARNTLALEELGKRPCLLPLRQT
jgi:hypothetical protein